jgi:hypothetical protein
VQLREGRIDCLDPLVRPVYNGRAPAGQIEHPHPFLYRCFQPGPPILLVEGALVHLGLLDSQRDPASQHLGDGQIRRLIRGIANSTQGHAAKDALT